MCSMGSRRGSGHFLREDWDHWGTQDSQRAGPGLSFSKHKASETEKVGFLRLASQHLCHCPFAAPVAPGSAYILLGHPCAVSRAWVSPAP